MKIMQVIPLIDTGGAQVMCTTLSIRLTKMNNEVIIVCFNRCESFLLNKLANNGIKVIFLDKKKGLDLTIFQKIKKIIKDFKPDIIHTHLYASKYIALLNHNIPIVHTIHSVADKENTKFGIIINKYFINRKRILPVSLSHEIQKTVVNTYGISSLRTPVVFNGIDIDDLKKQRSNEKVKSFNGKFIITHVGRFSEVKNQLLLIKAFELLCMKHRNFVLWLIGDGETFNDVKSYVNNSIARNNIVLWGNQDDVAQFLQFSSLFVLPSKYEGLPLSIAEAMSLGLPIIASNVGGIPDMIKNEYNGILIEPTVEGIISAVEKLYINEELTMTIKRNAERDSDKYSDVAMAKDYILVYEKSINGYYGKI